MNNKPQQENLLIERRVGIFLASLVVIALIYFVADPPQEASTTLPIIRFLAALCSGLSAFLFLGSLDVETHLPFSRGTIRGSGAFAAFIAIFFLFLYGFPTPNINEIPRVPEPNGTDESQDLLTPNINEIPRVPEPNGTDESQNLLNKYSETEFQTIQVVLERNIESIGNLLIKGVQPGNRARYVDTNGLEVRLNESENIIQVTLSVEWKGGWSRISFVNRFRFKINKENLVHDLDLLVDDGFDKARNVKGTESSLKEELDDLIDV
jgi:hypothetical protein